MSQALDMFKVMVLDFTINTQSTIILQNILTPYNLFTLLFGIIFVMPVLSFVKQKLAKINISPALSLGAVLVVFALCMIKLAASSFNPFIYTQF